MTNNTALMPDGSLYTMHTGERILGDGQYVQYPYFLSDDDTFEHDGYKYIYHKSIDGWQAELVDKEAEICGVLLGEIANKPLLSLCSTFADCKNLKEGPEIPDSVVDMKETFKGCTSLLTAKIGINVIDTESCFENCCSLNTRIIIPQKVRSAIRTFANCVSMTEPPAFDGQIDLIFADEMFENCENLIVSPDFSLSPHIRSINRTFSGCCSLKIVIPAPVSTQSAVGTFNGCRSLKSKPTLPPYAETDNTTFANTPFSK